MRCRDDQPTTSCASGFVAPDGYLQLVRAARQGHIDDVAVTGEDRKRWFDAFDVTGPHQLLVAETDGMVTGYASSSRYRSHPAFSATVEITGYLDPEARGRGLGALLYDELLERLAGEAVLSVVAAVALPNEASVGRHVSRGFREVGTFTEYATKGGQLISSTWFEKIL